MASNGKERIQRNRSKNCRSARERHRVSKGNIAWTKWGGVVNTFFCRRLPPSAPIPTDSSPKAAIDDCKTTKE